MSTKLTKKEEAEFAKAEKADKTLDKLFDNIITKLRKASDKYEVNDLFNKAYRLTQQDDIMCDSLTPLLDGRINEGEDLIDTYEEDLGNLDTLGVKSGKPTEKQAEKAGDVGTESIETRENNLAFVESYYYGDLDWFVFTNDDEDHLTFLDKQTAITAVKGFKLNASVIPNA